jgi:alpha-1,2-mannosyltransferase
MPPLQGLSGAQNAALAQALAIQRGESPGTPLPAFAARTRTSPCVALVSKVRMHVLSRTLAIALLASVLAIFAARTAIPAAQRLTHGFLAYYVAAQTVRDGEPGERLYDDQWFAARVMEASHGTVTDIYLANPPPLAVAWLPFAYLPAESSRRIWIALCVLCLGLSLWLIVAELSWSRRLWAIVAMTTLLAIAAPTREQTLLGQMYAFILLLHVIGWRAYVHRRDALAGVALGLAMILKLSGWPIGLLMLAQRRWSAVRWAVGSAVIVALATLPAVGLDAWRDFLLQAVPRTLHSASATLTAYQDTRGFWQHLFRYDATLNPNPLLDAPALASLLTLGTIAGSSLALVRGTRTACVGFAAAVALTELLSPAAEQYHYVVMLLPLAVLWREAWRVNDAALGCCAFAATVLLACPIDYKSTHPVWAILHNYPRFIGGWVAFAALLYADRPALAERRDAGAAFATRVGAA